MSEMVFLFDALVSIPWLFFFYLSHIETSVSEQSVVCHAVSNSIGPVKEVEK